MSHIFISYSHKDSGGYEKKLEADLRQRGYDVWIDESAVPLGSDWWAEIERGVDECDAFILLMSPSAEELKYVNAELQIALDDLSKPVIPLLVKKRDDERRIFRILGRAQFHDVSQGGLPSQSFYDQLESLNIVGSQTGTNVTPQPPLVELVTASTPTDDQLIRALSKVRECGDDQSELI